MTVQGNAALVWCPFPDEARARDAIGSLLAERLIACGNVVPGLRSLFRWQGELGNADECGALLKTSAPLLDAVMQRVGELHPYATPAIMGWTVQADPNTRAWLDAETGSA